MPGQTMASLAMQLVNEKLSNKRLRKMLREERAKALCTQTQQKSKITKLSFKVEMQLQRLLNKDKQIAEQNKELLELRTQVAALTDSLKCLKRRGRASGTKNNDNKWRYEAKERADARASGQKNNANEAKERSDGSSGGPSGRWKRLTRRKITDDFN